MLRKWTIGAPVSLVLLVAATAQGQTSDGAQMTLSDGDSFSMGFQGPPQYGQVFTTVPYSAEEIVEPSQTLADGTHVRLRPRTTHYYRDSMGRTRTERPFNLGASTKVEPEVVIDIRDPNAGFQYVLDTQNHVVHRVKLTIRTGQPASNSTMVTATKRQVGGRSSTQEPLGTANDGRCERRRLAGNIHH